MLSGPVIFFPGSYTATAGIPEIVQNISAFITRRDGGAPSDPDNIFITPGSQWSLMVTSLLLQIYALSTLKDVTIIFL